MLERMTPRTEWLIGAIGWLSFVTLFGAVSMRSFEAQGLDFDLWYAVGQLVASGAQTSVYDGPVEISPPFLYSIFTLPFFRALTLLPYDPCCDSFVLMKLLLFASWPLLLTLWLDPALGARTFLRAAAACAVVSPAAHEDLIVGNINIFLVTVLIYVALAYRGGLCALPVFALTVVCLFKPQLAAFAAPFVLRDWRAALVGGALGLMMAFVATAPLFSVADAARLTADWLQLIARPVSSAQDVNNLSTTALVERLLSDAPLLHTQGLESIHLVALPRGGIRAAVVASKLAVLGLTLLAARRVRRRGGERSLELFALLACFVALFSPLVWVTHLVLLLFPALWLTSTRSEPRDRRLLRRGLWLIASALAIYWSGSLWMQTEVLRSLSRAFALPLVLAALCLGALGLERPPAAQAVEQPVAQDPRGRWLMALPLVVASLAFAGPVAWIHARRVVVGAPALLEPGAPAARALFREWPVGRKYTNWSRDVSVALKADGTARAGATPGPVSAWTQARDGTVELSLASGERVALRFDGLEFGGYLLRPGRPQPWYVRLRLEQER